MKVRGTSFHPKNIDVKDMLSMFKCKQTGVINQIFDLKSNTTRFLFIGAALDLALENC